MTKKIAFTLTIPGRGSWPCINMAEASKQYSEIRERSGEGASTFPAGKLLGRAAGERFRVSYNGKIWNEGEWKQGDQPVFNPYEI